MVRSVISTIKRMYSHVAFKLKLKKIVCDLCATLARKHKHLVPAYSYREVATRWRNLTTLINLVDTKAERDAYTVGIYCNLNSLLVIVV